jgi:hypothetical protein
MSVIRSTKSRQPTIAALLESAAPKAVVAGGRGARESIAVERQILECGFESLESLQTKQMTTGENDSRWSYTFRNDSRVALTGCTTIGILPLDGIWRQIDKNVCQSRLIGSIRVVSAYLSSYNGMHFTYAG